MQDRYHIDNVNFEDYLNLFHRTPYINKIVISVYNS